MFCIFLWRFEYEWEWRKCQASRRHCGPMGLRECVSRAYGLIYMHTFVTEAGVLVPMWGKVVVFLHLMKVQIVSFKNVSYIRIISQIVEEDMHI